LLAGGIITGYYLPVNEQLLFMLLGLIIWLAIITIYIWRSNYQWWRYVLGPIIFLLGTVYFQAEAVNWQQEELKRYLNQPIKIKGRVKRVTGKSDSKKYVLTDLKFPDLPLTTDKKVLVTCWQPKQKFKPGTAILLTTKLHRPAPQLNPGGFSYRKYLRRQGIYAVGEVNSGAIDKIGGERNLLLDLLFDFRRQLSEQINCCFTAPYNYLLQALLLGQKDKLPDKIKQLFRRLGVSHLLVISGFHLGLISYFIFQLTVGLSAGSQIIVIEFVLTAYLILTGGQLPAVRAQLLITLTIIGQYLNRGTDLYNLLAGVAIIILLINPQSLLSVSFQLSVGAVAGIAALTPVINYYLSWLPNKVSEVIASTFAAQLSLFPLLSYHFNQFLITGVLANLILLPLISLSLIGGLIFSCLSLLLPSGARLMSEGLSWLLQLVVYVGRWLNSNLSLVLTVATPNLLEIGIYYLLIYCGFRVLQPVVIPYKKNYRRYLTIIGVSVVFLLMSNLGIIGQDLRVTFLAGQGDAVHLRTPSGKNILLDGGKRGQAAVNFLQSRGVDELDLIFISHFHQDHAGGLVKIMDNFSIDKICYPPVLEATETYDEVLQQARRKNIEAVELNKRDRLSLGETAIKVLGPGQLITEEPNNNNSLILQVVYNRFNLLLTGDIERLAENRLIKYSQQVEADILQVPHHGSSTSSSPDLIKEVTPQTAVISVARNNRYGHPDQEVVSRFKKRGIKVLRTDKQGAVTITTDGETYKCRTYLK